MNIHLKRLRQQLHHFLCLQLIVLGNVGSLEYLKYLPWVIRGKRIEHEEVVYRTTTNTRIEGIKIPFELDGEFTGYTPLVVSVVPSVLNLVK